MTDIFNQRGVATFTLGDELKGNVASFSEYWLCESAECTGKTAVHTYGAVVGALPKEVNVDSVEDMRLLIDSDVTATVQLLGDRASSNTATLKCIGHYFEHVVFEES